VLSELAPLEPPDWHPVRIRELIMRNNRMK
jgi:hypothetical protein